MACEFFNVKLMEKGINNMPSSCVRALSSWCLLETSPLLLLTIKNIHNVCYFICKDENVTGMKFIIVVITVI